MDCRTGNVIFFKFAAIFFQGSPASHNEAAIVLSSNKMDQWT
jgi:hypothetical protein